MDMMFCRGCGKQIHASARACPHCGAPQGIQKPPAKQVAPVAAVPDGVKGWSWGAFLLNVVWAIGNRTWIGLLCLVPGPSLVMPFVLGAKGREWAWKNKPWASLEQFNRVQRQWSYWGVVITAVALVLSVLAGVGAAWYERHEATAREDALWKQIRTPHEVLQEQRLDVPAAPSPAPAVMAEAPASAPVPVSSPAPMASAAVAAEAKPAAPAGLPAPKVDVGERVTLETVDHQNPRLNNTTTRTVTSVEGDAVTYKVVNAKSGYTRYLQYNDQMALMSTRSESGEVILFDPPLAYFKFPMRVGDTWRMDSTEHSGDVILRLHHLEGATVAQESITTPLGTFTAYKVELKTRTQTPEGAVSVGTDVSWYVPEFKRSVRSDLTSQNQDGSNFSSRTVTMTFYAAGQPR